MPKTGDFCPAGINCVRGLSFAATGPFSSKRITDRHRRESNSFPVRLKCRAADAHAASAGFFVSGRMVSVRAPVAFSWQEPVVVPHVGSVQAALG